MAIFRRPPADIDAPPARLSKEGLREAARLFAYLLPYRRLFAFALSCLLCSSLLSLAFPFVGGRLVDSARPTPDDSGPRSLGLSVDALALMLIGLLALQATFSFGHTYLLATVGERSLADLRRDTYARLIRLPMAFFANRRVGELTS